MKCLGIKPYGLSVQTWIITFVTRFISLLSLVKNAYRYKLLFFFFFAYQEDSMIEFECHYIEEMWFTAKYFEFVEDFFNTANSSREAEDCEPLPCPTSTKTTIISTTTASPGSRHHSTNGKTYVIIRFCTRAQSTHCSFHCFMKLL